MDYYKRRLGLLREEMRRQGIDAYIIPCTDPHIEENIPDHWKIVEWLSGFSGSAATLVITRTFAGLWTDSRFFLQAEKELQGTGFQLMPTGGIDNVSVNDWLQVNIKKGGIIAFDGDLLSAATFRKMKIAFKKKAAIFATDIDLITGLWENRPSVSDSLAFEHPADFAGLDRESKIRMIRGEMTVKNIDYHLLNSPGDIEWMLNFRGTDVKYSPLLHCRAIVGINQVLLFIDENKLPSEIAREFDRIGVVVLPFDGVNSLLASFKPESVLLLSSEEIPVSLFDSIPESIEIIDDISIPSRLKAVKNKTERENIRKVMIKDGVAMTRFFIWLEKNIETGKVTEESASGKLLELRLQQTDCTGESFPPIVAWNEHGAFPHYSFTMAPDTIIGNNGVLLVDSGGQYLGGTTDITRCISIGKPSEEMKLDFTLALKGTIALAIARFPYGTRGSQLDVFARKAMWDRGINYNHGTGHGVGYFLNVHESPPSISRINTGRFNLPLEPGMIVSDEPAIYREHKYGFRTENLIMIIEDKRSEFGQFLKFDTLTLCYIDRSLIDKSLLDGKELKWLNTYHTTVYASLSHFLNNEEKFWLKEKTAQL